MCVKGIKSCELLEIRTQLYERGDLYWKREERADFVCHNSENSFERISEKHVFIRARRVLSSCDSDSDSSDKTRRVCVLCGVILLLFATLLSVFPPQK